MLITIRQKRHRLETDQLNVKVRDDTLTQVEREKLLGVTVDSHLDWREHINKVYKKVLTNLALLRRIKRYLPYAARMTFYRSFIAVHFDYCITVWGSSSSPTSRIGRDEVVGNCKYLCSKHCVFSMCVHSMATMFTFLL